jgi:hypothetical protein
MLTRHRLLSAGSRTVIVAIAALLIGAALGPTAVSGVSQAVSKVFITNTATDPVPVVGTLTVGNPPTSLIASGSTSLGPSGSATLVNAIDVSGFRSVRVVAEASSHVDYEVLSGSLHISQQSGATRLSEVYEVPGLSLTWRITEVDGVSQTVTWAVFGRP